MSNVRDDGVYENSPYERKLPLSFSHNILGIWQVLLNDYYDTPWNGKLNALDMFQGTVFPGNIIVNLIAVIALSFYGLKQFYIETARSTRFSYATAWSGNLLFGNLAQAWTHNTRC